MYSLLIKDRSYPISVYMTYMLRVKGFTRTEAVELMTMAAHKMGMRKSRASPANNTVAEWGRSIDAPLWAVVSVMVILEQFGKVPFTYQEWACWAFAAAERGHSIDNYKGKWRDWLCKAEQYKKCYERRGELRKEFRTLRSPNTAAKVILAFIGNDIRCMSLAELFANLDESSETVKVLDKRITANEPFIDADLKWLISTNPQCLLTYEDIILTIQDLSMFGRVHHRSNDDIELIDGY
ncbi:hypothetical protein DFO55_12417 [Grimontella sp. AG753]|nr:hypothetical protein DFO55_12417 [Grimontella sp. AG753]